MKLSYDPRYNIAYLSFRNKEEKVETITVSSEMNIDIAPDGKVYGIEFLNANEQLKEQEIGRLLLINEATGKQSEMALDLK